MSGFGPCDLPRSNKDLSEYFESLAQDIDAMGPEDFDGPEMSWLDPEIEHALGREAQWANRKDRGMFTLGRFFRPTGDLMQTLEAQTDVPFYKWYRTVEDGRDAVEKFMAPHIPVLRTLMRPLPYSDRVEVQRLLEGRNLPGYSQAYLTAPERIRTAADQLWKEYMLVGDRAGFSQKEMEDLLTSVFPEIRERDGNFTAWKKGRSFVGKMTTVLSRSLQTGEIGLRPKQMDANATARQVFRALAYEKELTPRWNSVAQQFNAYADAGGANAFGDTYAIFDRYLKEVRHMPDTWQIGITRTVNNFLRKVEQMPGVKGKFNLTQDELFDFTGFMASTNYLANMAWNTGMVLRNSLQVFQTTYPLLGEVDTVHGMKTAIRWLKNKGLQELMEQRAVVTRDVMHERFREVSEVASHFGGGSVTGKVRDLGGRYAEYGNFLYKKTDDFNRVAAYSGAVRKIERHAQEYVSRKTPWHEWIKETGIDVMDENDGPFLREVRAHLDKGDVDAAAHTFGKRVAEHTQFKYSRGNNPYILQGTVGRFFGQYGTWPAWWANYMRDMALRGSPENRIKMIARWGAANVAMYHAAKGAFNVDLGRWLFFSPLGYTGGPFLEIAGQAGSALNVATAPEGQSDPVDQINRARLIKNFAKQTTPVPWNTIRNTERAWDDLFMNGEWGDATRNFLGFPKAK